MILAAFPPTFSASYCYSNHIYWTGNLVLVLSISISIKYCFYINLGIHIDFMHLEILGNKT